MYRGVDCYAPTAALTAQGVIGMGIDLSGLGLNGSLPEVLGCSVLPLAYLHLSNNRLRGTLPVAWGNQVYITTLLLGFNALTGPLPDTWGQIAELTVRCLQRSRVWQHYGVFVLWDILGCTLPSSFAGGTAPTCNQNPWDQCML